MIYKDFSSIDEDTKKKIVLGSIIPRPIAWIATLSENDTVNLAPFSYFSMSGPIYATVSILRSNGKMKDTARNLIRNKEAVIHIADYQNIANIDATSEPLDYGVSEVDKVGLSLVASKKIQTPGILEAKIRLESTLLNHQEITEDNVVIADLITVKFVAAHLDPEIYDEKRGFILENKLDPLSRLAGPLYAQSKPLYDFKRQF